MTTPFAVSITDEILFSIRPRRFACPRCPPINQSERNRRTLIDSGGGGGGGVNSAWPEFILARAARAEETTRPVRFRRSFGRAEGLPIFLVIPPQSLSTSRTRFTGLFAGRGILNRVHVTSLIHAGFGTRNESTRI